MSRSYYQTSPAQAICNGFHLFNLCDIHSYLSTLLDTTDGNERFVNLE